MFQAGQAAWASLRSLNPPLSWSHHSQVPGGGVGTGARREGTRRKTWPADFSGVACWRAGPSYPPSQRPGMVEYVLLHLRAPELCGPLCRTEIINDSSVYPAGLFKGFVTYK